MSNDVVPAGSVAPPGLKGLIVADTAVGTVLGDEGWYHYRGRDATELARSASFETIACLLLDGTLPPAGAEAELAAELADYRRLGSEALDLVVRLSHTGLDPLAVLAGALPLVVDGRPTIDMTHTERRRAVIQAIGAAPTVLGTVNRIRSGGRAGHPRPELVVRGPLLEIGAGPHPCAGACESRREPTWASPRSTGSTPRRSPPGSSPAQVHR